MTRDSGQRVDPLLALLVVGPALCLGGVPGWTVPLFGALAALTLGWRWHRARKAQKHLAIPKGWPLFAFAAAWTALAILPMPSGLVAVLAPGPHALATKSLAYAGVEGWSRVSVLPGATTLELGRVVSLGLIFSIGAQANWRTVAAACSVGALAVLAIGLGQLALDSNTLLGIYQPIETSPLRDSRWGLFTTFINPNHLGAYFLLSATCSLALARDDDPSRALSNDGRLFFSIALLLQLVGIVLSQSRASMLSAALVGLACLLILWRAQKPYSAPGQPRWLSLSLLAGFVGMLALGGRQAWTQLQSLSETRALTDKYESVLASLELIPQAAWVGTGRGTSVDLLPSVYPQGGGILFTQIECAPVAMLVEWGPLGGGAILLGSLLVLRGLLRRAKSPSRQILVVGLLGLAVQNLADFNWIFLGVSAPALALAGSLSPRRSGREAPPPPWAIPVVLSLSVVVTLLSLPASSRGFTGLRSQHRQVAKGHLSLADALARRPLDARSHIADLRSSYQAGKGRELIERAEFVATLSPWSVDLRLILHRLYVGEGRGEDARRVLAQALAAVRVEDHADLVPYLCASLPASDLRDLPPIDTRGGYELGRALVRACPEHADALAEASSRGLEASPRSLELRARANVKLQRPLLARYYASQWVALEGQRASAHALLSDALRLGREDGPLRAEAEREIRASLAEALDQPDLDDPATLEELYLWSLSRSATPEEVREALEGLAPALLERSAAQKDRLRRVELIERLRQQLSP